MELKTKKVLVTGGAKRIGRAIALAFAREGCGIALHYHRSREEAERTREEIAAFGVRCDLLSCDLTDLKAVRAMLEAESKIVEQVSVLVNSASLFYPNVSRCEDEKLFAIHYEAPLCLSRAVGLRLKEHGENGAIINITDAMLRRPVAGYENYFASKAALENLTRALSVELAPTVRVNAVAPGCILFPDGYSEERQKAILEKIPLKRKGEPEDIAQACVFLAKVDYVNATTLAVDGGRSL